jgi:hypothetical protein
MRKMHFVWVLVLIFVAVTVTFFVNWGEYDVVIQKVFYLIGPITALVAGGMAIKKMGSRGKRANVLKSVILALGLWLVAEIVTLYMVYTGNEPYPSMADVLFLAGYAAFSIAVVWEVKLFGFKLRNMNRKIAVGLGIIFLITLTLVGYIAVKGFRPEESLLSNVTTLSWSMGDVVMGGLGLVLLGMAWEFRQGTVKKEWLWFMAATLINLVADMIYNLYPEALADGSMLTIVLDVMWQSGYFLMAGYFLEIRREVTRLQGKLIA